MRRLALILLLLASAVAMYSMPADSIPSRRGGWFRYVPYGHSLYADVHPNTVRMDFLWSSNHPYYDYAATGRAYRPSVNGTFGFQLPIWRGDLDEGRFSLGVTMAMSACLWLDLYEPKTSPVINTDYRIGLPTVTFVHRLSHPVVHNYSLAYSLFKHESTHVGDELLIRHMEQEHALRRVNVSYNYTELVFTMNEAESRYAEYHTLRLGLLILWQPRQGWYSVKAEDGDASLAQPRLSPWEMYLQYQYQSPTSPHGFQGIVSAEIRNRVVYGYDLGSTAEQPVMQDERRRFTYNVFVGARYNTPGYDGYFSRVALGVRAYHGNCPYGQFRSIDHYSQIGVSLIFE